MKSPAWWLFKVMVGVGLFLGFNHAAIAISRAGDGTPRLTLAIVVLAVWFALGSAWWNWLKEGWGR